MKTIGKLKKQILWSTACVITAVVVGCLPVIRPPEGDNLPAGKGRLVFTVGGGSARTIMPDLDVILNSCHYEVTLTMEDDPDTTSGPYIVRQGEAFGIIINSGKWFVHTKAYQEDTGELVGEGADSVDVVENQIHTITLNVNLIAGNGVGTFSYSLMFPGNKEQVKTLRITLVNDNGDEQRNDIDDGDEDFDLDPPFAPYVLYNGSFSDLPAGSYQVTVFLELTDGSMGNCSETAVIYGGFETYYNKNISLDKMITEKIVSGTVTVDGQPGRIIVTAYSDSALTIPLDSDPNAAENGEWFLSIPITTDAVWFGVRTESPDKNLGCYGYLDAIPWEGQEAIVLPMAFYIVRGDIKFQLVPAGSFQRDNPADVSVIANDFWMGETEITQEVFAAVMGVNPSYFTDDPAPGETQKYRPVECVSWYDAIAFCNKLSLLDGKDPVYSVKVNGSEVAWPALSYNDIPTESNADWDAVVPDLNKNGYRLPTAAEWMWAAMGADTAGYGKKFAGSNGSNNITNYAWYKINNNDPGKTHEVGKKTANELGLFDMSGNVVEWIWDWWPSADPPARLAMGGSYRSTLSQCMVALLNGTVPYYRGTSFLGFRVAHRVEGGSPASYTVTFNSKGGTAAAPSSVVVSGGALVAQPNNVTKSGYVLAGWYKNEDYSGIPWNFAVNTVTEDTTLYAKWEQQQPTIQSVTIEPGAFTMSAGETKQFKVDVQTEPAAAPAAYKQVTWTITSFTAAETFISAAGLLTVAQSQAAGVFTIRATSVSDPGKYGEAMVYVAASDGGSNSPFTVTFAEPANENIDLSMEVGDRYGVVSWADNTPIEITVNNDYESYEWYIDGVRSTENDGKKTLRLYAQDFSIAQHRVTAVVVKDGKQYSKIVTFTVVEGSIR
jgi:uncharacterized repeat protein (TIGR02543 family)